MKKKEEEKNGMIKKLFKKCNRFRYSQILGQ